MQSDITQLLSPTLTFMLLCYFVTLAVRKVLEARWPALKANSDWMNFVLPGLPALLGVAFAFIPKYPIPAVFIASPWSKVVWGFVAGILSTWAYDIVQAVLRRLFGFDINTLKRSDHPAPLDVKVPMPVFPPNPPVPKLDAPPPPPVVKP